MLSSLSILASPKDFTGPFAAIQDRALESWTRVCPPADILLYGEGQGVREAAARYGTVHVPEVACSRSGAPLFNAVAEHARLHARHSPQIYLNADIILPPDLLSRIGPMIFPQWLICGERIDLAEGVQWDLNQDFQEELSQLVAAGRAQAHGATGMDYFVFPRGLWDGLQGCVVGRGGYDNALIAFCLRRRIPIVDATAAIPVVHQWHGYSHVTGGVAEAHRGEEALGNYRGHDVLHSQPDIGDADWVMHRGELRPGNCRGDRLRLLEIRLRYRWGFKLASYGVRAVWRLARTLRVGGRQSCRRVNAVH